jgi:hypothetical protein
MDIEPIAAYRGLPVDFQYDKENMEPFLGDHSFTWFTVAQARAWSLWDLRWREEKYRNEFVPLAIPGPVAPEPHHETLRETLSWFLSRLDEIMVAAEEQHGVTSPLDVRLVMGFDS